MEDLILLKPSRLKMLREYGNYDIATIAKMIDRPVDEVKSWEQGKAVPDIVALRDLAVEVFHTSVDDLLWINPFTPAMVSTGFLYTGGENESPVSGFWGHVGVLTPGMDQTRWYPIDDDNYRYGYREVQVRGPHQWAGIRTLANRVLAINPQAMQRIWFLDDACDGPTGNWEDIVDHNPMEFYRVLDLYAHSRHGTGEYQQQTSKKLQSYVAKYIEEWEKEHGSADGPLEEFHHWLHDTVIHFTNGKTVSYHVDGRDLATLYRAIETSHEMDDDGWGVPRMIHLDHAYGDFQSWFPRDTIAMVDMPMIDLWDAVKRENDENDMEPDWEEFERENARREGRVSPQSGGRTTRKQPLAKIVAAGSDDTKTPRGRGGRPGPRKQVLTPRRPKNGSAT